MNTEKITELKNKFEETAQEIEGVEFWYARDLQKLLEYGRWNKFLNAIKKAKESCENSGEKIENHMSQVERMVKIGSGAERKVEDIILTRYACYLVAQNSDSSKESVAFAQTYFALQTRKQELLEERMRLQERMDARDRLSSTEKTFSKLIYQRGVDERGFGRIRSKGDKALFGGMSTKALKAKMEVPKNRPLADFLPTVSILSKALATEMSNINVKNKNLHGEESITKQHINSNQKVRNALLEDNIIPENLPPEEDIKKIQRRVKREEKKISKESQIPPKKDDDLSLF